MTWYCQRGCGTAGRKTYPMAAQARRFAAAFDREDRDDLGRRAPFVGFVPAAPLAPMARAAAAGSRTAACGWNFRLTRVYQPPGKLYRRTI